MILCSRAQLAVHGQSWQACRGALIVDESLQLGDELLVLVERAGGGSGRTSRRASRSHARGSRGGCSTRHGWGDGRGGRWERGGGCNQIDRDPQDIPRLQSIWICKLVFFDDVIGN